MNDNDQRIAHESNNVKLLQRTHTFASRILLQESVLEKIKSSTLILPGKRLQTGLINMEVAESKDVTRGNQKSEKERG